MGRGDVGLPHGESEMSAQITGDSDISIQTISRAGVLGILNKSPLLAYADVFMRYASSYGVDMNWALSYIQLESGLDGTHFAYKNNNPWDIRPWKDTATGDNWGSIGIDHNPNGFTYCIFPSMDKGIEAGFYQWRKYKEDGFGTWYTSLDRAVGHNDAWVSSVIGQGNYNQDRFPADGTIGGSSSAAGGTPATFPVSNTTGPGIVNGGTMAVPDPAPAGASLPVMTIVVLSLIGIAAVAAIISDDSEG